MGRSCVRFRKVDDLALDVIGESIRRVSARAFIKYYESFIKTMRRRPAGNKAAKSLKTEKKKGAVRSALAAKGRKLRT